MNEIVIVTAFFDIKREQIKLYKRTNEQYFSYFENWAKIKNRIVVFCDEKHKNTILDIRCKYNLQNKTDIYLIDNIINLDKDLYESICRAMNSRYFTNFMYFNRNPEVVNPLYNYLMCIKPLFVEKAIEKFKLTGTIAWLDFGFNYGLKYYPYTEEFNFLWNYEFDPNFIHLFKIKEIPDLPIFEIIRRMNSYIQGGTLITDSKNWSIFRKIIRENMLVLNNVGLADDDQVLLLMGYKNYPNLFRVHNAYWNEAMKLFGGNHLTYVKKVRSKNHFKKILISLRLKKIKLLNKIRYLYRTYKILSDGEIDD